MLAGDGAARLFLARERTPLAPGRSRPARQLQFGWGRRRGAPPDGVALRGPFHPPPTARRRRHGTGLPGDRPRAARLEGREAPPHSTGRGDRPRPRPGLRARQLWHTGGDRPHGPARPHHSQGHQDRRRGGRRIAGAGGHLGGGAPAGAAPHPAPRRQRPPRRRPHRWQPAEQRPRPSLPQATRPHGVRPGCARRGAPAAGGWRDRHRRGRPRRRGRRQRGGAARPDPSRPGAPRRGGRPRTGRRLLAVGSSPLRGAGSSGAARTRPLQRRLARQHRPAGARPRGAPGALCCGTAATW